LDNFFNGEKNMKAHRESWVLGVIAHCTECNVIFEDYTTARKQAAQHAKKTGHRIVGEVTRHFEYGGKVPNV
jgi:hypothetical protein